MKRLLIGFVVAALGISMVDWAMAKDPSAQVSADMLRFQKIIGQKAMSAQVVMTLTNAKRANPMGPMEYELKMSKGKVRMEMDMAKMAVAAGGGASKQMTGVSGGGGEAAMAPALGQMVTLIRPDQKMIYQVMPTLTAYYVMPITEGASDKADTVKIDRKVMGSEKIDSYTCDKVLNTITSESNSHEMTTWEAKEFGGLPIKMEMNTPEGSMILLFKNIKTSAIDDAQFEPPTGYTKCGSMEEMIMQGMMKMMQRRQ